MAWPWTNLGSFWLKKLSEASIWSRWNIGLLACQKKDENWNESLEERVRDRGKENQNQRENSAKMMTFSLRPRLHLWRN
jgi:hypothetical protein